MPVVFTPATVVEEIGTKLIEAYFPQLYDIRVEYVFRSEAAHSGGRVVLGRCRKVSGMEAMLATPHAVDSAGLDFWVIEMAADFWPLLTPHQQTALTHHELSHAGVDENDQGELVLRARSHDVEEFSEVIRIYGLWRPDLVATMAAVGSEQLKLIADNLEGIEQVRAMEPSSEDKQAAADRVAERVRQRQATPARPSTNVISLFGWGGESDEVARLLPEAARIFVENAVASPQMLRKLTNQAGDSIGNALASAITEECERLGIIGPDTGSKTRTVLIDAVPAELLAEFEGETGPDDHEELVPDPNAEADPEPLDEEQPGAPAIPPDDEF